MRGSSLRIWVRVVVWSADWLAESVVGVTGRARRSFLLVSELMAKSRW